MENNLKCFFIVYGKHINNNFDNVKSISTRVIPNIGETIIAFDGRLKVNDKVITYKHVENYELDDPNRGGEMVYVFVDKI